MTAATARSRLAPEVIQTSAMDCGPAALKCLLDGHGLAVSYGRLRELCQTSVDGTSIDDIETVANRLGLIAEQSLIPVDHLLLDGRRTRPAIVVVARPGGATHFVVVWRSDGRRLQVMDPAAGRRGMRIDRFLAEVFRHTVVVPPDQWRHWAGTPGFLDPLRRRMADLGLPRVEAERLIERGVADAMWFTLGALDATLRLTARLVAAGGVETGADAGRLATALLDGTLAAPDDIHALIPAEFWSVAPAAAADRGGLAVTGAVTLAVSGVRPGAAVEADTNADDPLAAGLASARERIRPRPLRDLWDALRRDGSLAPGALLGAAVMAAMFGATEALLMRGLLEIGSSLALGVERLTGLAALLGFLVIAVPLRLSFAAAALRLGRVAEISFRMALFEKLPRLEDRYLRSRPTSDMADRAHAVHGLRSVPGLAMTVLVCSLDIVVTLAGLALIEPGVLAPALAAAALALGMPMLATRWIAERDMRLRIHGGALTGFQLDALLGLVPIRVHRAEIAMRREHETLLAAWITASRRLLDAQLLVGAAQSFAILIPVALIVIGHGPRGEAGSGAGLLLVFWAMKLPALGATASSALLRLAMQGNAMLRLQEPLHAPETPALPAEDLQAAGEGASPKVALRVVEPAVTGASLSIANGRVVAGGHTILEDIDLVVRPGEHVAIVGPSGAGKSSLVGLALGWYGLAEGRFEIDGEPAGPGEVAALRRRTAWVDPTVQVWNRSLVENIAFAAEAPDPRRMIDAIDGADLRAVLRTLPEGLKTRLGDGGALLSGGQAQRVRLARAFAQTDVRLALLDEPFRGLDRDHRAELLDEARRRWRGTTLVCVTHDIADTLGFDRVVVVADGRIAEAGPPADLLAAGGAYADLLAAETRTREVVWQARGWRRLRLENGRLHPVAGDLASLVPKAGDGLRKLGRR